MSSLLLKSERTAAIASNSAMQGAQIVEKKSIIRIFPGFAPVEAPFLVIALFIGSAWYCLSYLPDELARSLSRVKKTSAPTFTLVPLSQDRKPALTGS